jgi:hypothetical protein
MIKQDGTSLPKKTCVGNRKSPSLVSINGRGKECSPNRLMDNFQDLWYDNLVQAWAIQASFLLESNAGFDTSVSSLFPFDWRITKRLFQTIE